MLVLSRKTGEQIVIGDNVVTINRIAGNRVTLGIQADSATRILRGELIDKPVEREGGDCDGPHQ